jgi:hypothetical protein
MMALLGPFCNFVPNVFFNAKKNIAFRFGVEAWF